MDKNDKESKKGIDQDNYGNYICQMCHNPIYRIGQEYCDKCGHAIDWPENVSDNPYIIKNKSWSEFRDTGLLWFINTILHVFGWAIVVIMDKVDGENVIINVYPARVKYRGFSTSSNDRGYKNVTNYLKDNIDDLVEEVNEDD